MDEEKEQKKKAMMDSIKGFVTNMVRSEEQYWRFKQMGDDDNKELTALVEKDIMLSKDRYANSGTKDDDVIS